MVLASEMLLAVHGGARVALGNLGCSVGLKLSDGLILAEIESGLVANIRRLHTLDTTATIGAAWIDDFAMGTECPCWRAEEMEFAQFRLGAFGVCRGQQWRRLPGVDARIGLIATSSCCGVSMDYVIVVSDGSALVKRERAHAPDLLLRAEREILVGFLSGAWGVAEYSYAGGRFRGDFSLLSLLCGLIDRDLGCSIQSHVAHAAMVGGSSLASYLYQVGLEGGCC